MSCINKHRDDVLTISQLEDTSKHEFGEVIDYLGEKFIVYYITDEIIKAVKMTDKRNIR